MESKSFEIYLASFLPNGQPFPREAARYSTFGWTGVIGDICQQNPLVRHAVFACALAILGQQNGQLSMTVNGCRMYGKSLQALAQSILTMRQERSDTLHITSKLLAQYEVCQPDFDSSNVIRETKC